MWPNAAYRSEPGLAVSTETLAASVSPSASSPAMLGWLHKASHAMAKAHVPRNTRRAAPNSHTSPNEPSSFRVALTSSVPPLARTRRRCWPADASSLAMSSKAAATTPVPQLSVSASTPRSNVRIDRASSSATTTLTLQPCGA